MPAQLLMFEEIGCEWCERWDEEVGAVYSKTPEGRSAPLRKVMIHQTLPDGIKLSQPVTYTPSFVLIEDGREIGRITGYPGEDFFWGYLGNLIAKLRPGKQTRNQQALAVRRKG